MASEANRQQLERMFEAMVAANHGMIEQLGQIPDDIVEEARTNFREMLDVVPYVDDLAHTMASSMHFCAVLLAVYLAMRARGVDVHDFGAHMLDGMRRRLEQMTPPLSDSPNSARVEHARASQQQAADNEFVFEVLGTEGEPGQWAMSIKSCAICSLYGKYDAMDLVPYMCASDDVVSDIAGQGLRRTGSIALGASHCDFVFNAGGEGQHLSALYPDRIRLLDAD